MFGTHGFKWSILIQEQASQHTNPEGAKLIARNEWYWLKFSRVFLGNNSKNTASSWQYPRFSLPILPYTGI